MTVPKRNAAEQGVTGPKYRGSEPPKSNRAAAAQAALLYSSSMSAWRASGLVRAVVVVLLAWTAIDMTNAWLCQLDNEGSVAVLFGDEASSISGAGSLPASPAAPPSAAHVDDCFCCSHCVRPGLRAPIPAPLAIVRVTAPLAVQAIQSASDPLDHPPQFRS